MRPFSSSLSQLHFETHLSLMPHAAILALVKGELDVVRSSMLGSILSNCLLVAGGAFFVGGIRCVRVVFRKRRESLTRNGRTQVLRAILLAPCRPNKHQPPRSVLSSPPPPPPSL